MLVGIELDSKLAPKRYANMRGAHAWFVANKGHAMLTDFLDAP